MLLNVYGSPNGMNGVVCMCMIYIRHMNTYPDNRSENSFFSVGLFSFLSLLVDVYNKETKKMKKKSKLSDKRFVEFIETPKYLSRVYAKAGCDNIEIEIDKTNLFTIVADRNGKK